MAEIIEIENGLVRRKRVDVIAEQRLEDILPFMERRMPVTAVGLPDNLIAIHYDEQDPNDKKMEVLIELPPKVRTIPLARTGVNHHPTIALPWTIFHFAMQTHAEGTRGTDWIFNYYRCFFAKESGQNLDQYVIPALLPNVFESGEICFGNTVHGQPATLGARINQIVNEWYLSNFNNVGHVRPHYLPWGERTFDRWEKETETNPNCWQNWPEWDLTDTTQEHLRLRDIFAPNADFKGPIILPDGIPDIPVAPTFGMAEEWLRALEPHQRWRLRVALENIAAEAPNTIQPPVIRGDA